MLSPRVQAAAKASVIGREITVRELRLMPYLQYVMVNERCLDPRHVNQEERDILAEWRKAGWIEGGASGLSMTKEFWTALQEILWAGYATYDSEIPAVSPALPTVTVPITFTVINAPGWTHGSLMMTMPGTTFSIKKRKIGEVSSDMGGTPVISINRGKDDFILLATDSKAMFVTVRDAVGKMDLPKENPTPAPKEFAEPTRKKKR